MRALIAVALLPAALRAWRAAVRVAYAQWSLGRSGRVVFVIDTEPEG